MDLQATGAYGRKATVKDWNAGKDMARLVTPQPWIGGPYFSIRDVQALRHLGYKVVYFVDSGWRVDL